MLLICEEKRARRNLATFIKHETAFSKSLVDLKDNVGKLVSSESYQEQILKISEQTDHLDWQVQRAKKNYKSPKEENSSQSCKERKNAFAQRFLRYKAFAEKPEAAANFYEGNSS